VIFFLIDLLSFSPVTRTEDADPIASIRKPDGQNAVIDFAKTIKADLIITMVEVFGDHAPLVSEGMLRIVK
jgi:hypothetical protein